MTLDTSMKFAVIETGGKQYRVSTGDVVRVEKLAASSEGAVSFDRVLLLVDGEDVQIGTPYLEGKKVDGKVVEAGRDKKKIVFRYHSKTRHRKKKGHRQPFTEVRIVALP